MPEGDTIFRTAEALRAGLKGKKIRHVGPDRLKRLAGTTVTDVAPIGKHLMIRFDNGLALHTHMRMRGAWHVYSPGQRWMRPQWQVKVVLETDDAVAVCFSAPVVDLVRDEATKVGHLGPDILGTEWNPLKAVNRARSLGSTTIGEVLLDQRVAAGVGNVYRCEAMWAQKINPWRPVAELGDDALVGLFDTAREAMRSNLGQSPFRRFPGYGRGAVLGRAGRPCPRCGKLVRVRAQGEHARLTYWCPNCQL
jgi:formamidopyrimidine-DNA glycosylase